MIAVTPAGSYLVLTDYGSQDFCIIGPDGCSNYDENLSTIRGICSIKALDLLMK